MGFRSALGSDSLPPDESPRRTRSRRSETSSNAAAVRTFLLVALGTIAAAYAISRYVDGRDADVEATLETVRNRTTSAVPAPVEERVSDTIPARSPEIPIGSRTGEADEGEEPSEGDATDAADAITDAETNVDLVDDRSADEIDERTTDDVDEVPAEPGEMTVDDDLADAIGATDEDYFETDDDEEE